MLELAVRCRLAVTDDFRLIQIGANDGKMDDPLYSLITRYKLKGLLVEPMPDYFEQLCRNYADQPQLTFENCAISDHDGEQELFRIRKGASSIPGIYGVASFDKKVTLSLKPDLPGVAKCIESIRVKTLTIASLYRKHRIESFDLLQVDAEGYDHDIITMVMAAGVMPYIIHYEHAHLTPPLQDDCCRMLDDRGFRLCHSRSDTLALRDF